MLALALTISPKQVNAQLGGLDKLLEQVTDVAISYGRGTLNKKSDLAAIHKKGGSTLGIELLFGLGAVTNAAKDTESCAARAGAVRDKQKKKQARDSVVAAMLPCADTSGKVTSAVFDGTLKNTPAKFTSNVTITPYDPGAADTVFLFELSVGYSQISGLKLRESNDSLYASLRELPSLTFYTTWFPHVLDGHVAPYVGVRTGLVSFHNSQAYDGDKIFGLKAETFQLGPIIGIVLTPPRMERFNFFVESSWQWRSFGSVEWSGGGDSVPARFAKKFNANTRTVNIGLQLETKGHGR